MPAQLEVRNGNNVVIIDNNTANMAVLSQGTYNVGGGSLPVGGLGTILAMSRTGPESLPFNWWIFGRGSSGLNSGLILRDAANQITFDSSLKQARVVDTFVLGSVGSGPVNKIYPAGRTYATAVSLLVFTDVEVRGVQPAEEYRITSRRTYATVNGQNISGGWHGVLIQDWAPVPPGGVASFPAPAYTPWVVVLDVTDY